MRRYFSYLGRSIDNGTQWAVFEPNGERLWANIRDTISAFLYNEWRNGALLGATPKEAFFVRCDRGTMDQNDLDQMVRSIIEDDFNVNVFQFETQSHTEERLRELIYKESGVFY